MIYTSYYGNINNLKKAGVKSVAISAIVPSWLPYIDVLEILAPPKNLIHETNILKFRNDYIAHLESVGVEKIKSELRKRHGNIALVCYESIGDIKSSAKFCHRRMFASWYEDRTGIVIPEYDVAAIAEAERISNPTFDFTGE